MSPALIPTRIANPDQEGRCREDQEDRPERRLERVTQHDPEGVVSDQTPGGRRAHQLEAERFRNRIRATILDVAVVEHQPPGGLLPGDQGAHCGRGEPLATARRMGDDGDIGCDMVESIMRTGRLDAGEDRARLTSPSGADGA